MPEPGFWKALYEKMLSALEEGAFMRFNGYTVPGKTFQYRSIADFLQALEWVKGKADMEEGVRPYRARTYAANGGRG
jgi:hypothetical protein